jgi:hypothetical protein
MFKLISLLLLLSLSLQAEPLPGKNFGSYIKLQYAGFLGLGAFGAGDYFFNQKLETELLYGYTPKQVSTVDIHTITLKNSYIPIRFYNYSDEIYPYIGIGISYLPKNRYAANERSEVPSNYYHITSINALIYAGLSYKKSYHDYNDHERAVRFFIEVATLDSYLVSYITNPNFLDIQDIYSLALGVAYHY